MAEVDITAVMASIGVGGRPHYELVTGPNGHRQFIPVDTNAIKEGSMAGSPFIGRSPDPSVVPGEEALRAQFEAMGPDERATALGRLSRVLESMDGVKKARQATLGETIVEQVASGAIASEVAESSAWADFGSSVMGAFAGSAIDGLVSVGAEGALYIGREALCSLVDSMASRGFLAKLPIIGRRIRGRRIAEAMAKPAYKLVEYFGTAGVAAGLEAIPGMPTVVVKSIRVAKRKVMSVQAAELAKVAINNALVRRALAIIRVPKLLTGAAEADKKDGAA